LRSSDPADRRGAARWFAANAPDDGAEKGAVARSLAALLGELSPEMNGLALRGLKLWATRDCLPELVELARRQDRAGDGTLVAANISVLIDVLAQFPDESAAEAIALQLKRPEQRVKAAQALLKLGAVATGPVLGYLDDPDRDVRREARALAGALKVPSERQLEQALADLTGPRKASALVALRSLARLRPDEAGRTRASRALNTPLLGPDATIRAAALDAVLVWGTRENAGPLVKLLSDTRAENTERGLRTSERIVRALIAIGPGAQQEVAPLLKSPDGLLRRQACWALAEVGTSASVPALRDAGVAYLPVDAEFYELTKDAIATIAAREGRVEASS
jgi:hypothetical protein